MLPMSKALIAVFICGIMILLQRAFPFILFSKKNPPAIISFIEKYIPPMAMAALLFYCVKDINFINYIEATGAKNIDWKGFIPTISGIVLTVALHLWKRNSLISIFGGTIVYMILMRVL